MTIHENEVAMYNNVDLRAIEEFAEKQRVYLVRVAALEETTQKRDSFRSVQDNLRSWRRITKCSRSAAKLSSIS